VDLIFVLTELFSTRCYGYQSRLEISISEGVGQFRPKFQTEGGIHHQPFLHGKIG